MLAGDGDAASDPVCEQVVSRVPGVFLEVVVGPELDRLARDALRTLAGEHHEREGRIVRFNRLEEVEAVGSGHLVVTDDATDPRIVLEGLEGVFGVGFDPDRKVVFVLEVGRDEIAKRPVVVDEENANVVGIDAVRFGGVVPIEIPSIEE